MSYYSSKHPGLYLYLTLVIISVLSFLFFDMGSTHIGILAILWGSYTALRTLTLYEMSEYYSFYARNAPVSKQDNTQTSALAHDLVHRMSSGSTLKLGLRALNCLHDRTILWFVFALIYTAYHLHLSTPVLTKTALTETMCTLFMIGAAFWGGQSYAHSKKISQLLEVLFSALLLLAFYKLQNAISLSAIYPGNIGYTPLFDISSPQAILGLLALYSAAILLYAMTQRKKNILNALTGICLVVLLAASHIMFEPSHQTTALWIAGWGLFSVFWTRAFRGQEKRYIIHQC